MVGDYSIQNFIYKANFEIVKGTFVHSPLLYSSLLPLPYWLDRLTEGVNV